MAMDLGSTAVGSMHVAPPLHPHFALAASNLWNRMWFREGGSNFVDSTDMVFFYTFWISTLFFVVLMFLMVYWGVKYRKRPGRAAIVSASHNTPLEIVWTVIPTILFAVMFFWGLYTYLPKVVSPSNAELINVSGSQWNWQFVYKNGASSLQMERMSDREQSLYALPKGRPVKFLMSSEDVIHSFYIPEFRIKRDVLPNRYTTCWATPTVATHKWDPATEKAVPISESNPGFHLFCAEYCGDQHSQMSNRIAVMEDPDYQAWLNKQADTSGISLAELGQKLVAANGCLTCHSIDGSAKTGPTWKGIWGQVRSPVGGKSAISDHVDFNYVRQSVLEPSAYVREGFSNQMPTFQGKLKPREILAIATYIMSLTDSAKAQELSTQELNERGADGRPPDSEQFFNPTK